MSCKECSYFKGGFCSNLDTIVDPDDEVCMGFAIRKGRGMKLLIENPVEEVVKKLEEKKAFTEEDLEGIVIKEVLNINSTALGIRVIFRTSYNVLEEIELINSDCRNIDLYTD